ncbi:MAG: ABC transporter substrate-binding protein [Actinomycetota bacterium]
MATLSTADTTSRAGGARRRPAVARSLAALLVVLAACSVDEKPDTDPAAAVPSDTDDSSASRSATTTTPDSDDMSVTTVPPDTSSPSSLPAATTTEPADLDTPTVLIDAFDNEVVIPPDPQRVFAGDDTSLANLLDLGIRPVGAAVNQNSVPDFLGEQLDGITDVSAEGGLRVNFEALAALEPDVIVGPGTTLLKLQYDLANEIAPTYAYRYGYASSDELRTNLTDLARVFGLEAQAEQIVAELDARVADLAQRLSTSARADETVSVVRIFADGAGLSLRHGTIESVLMAEIGVARPPNQQSIEAFATELSLETLDLADADTIYLYSDDPDDPTVYDSVVASPLWQTLTATRNDRVFVVDGGVWNGISISAANLILDDLEETLGL